MIEATIAIASIDYRGRRIACNPPVTFAVSRDGGRYRADNDDLLLFASAETPIDLLADIADELLIAWEAYACEDDARMTAHAVGLARELRARLTVERLVEAPR